MGFESFRRRETAVQEALEVASARQNHVYQEVTGSEGKWLLRAKRQNFIPCSRDVPASYAIENFLEQQAATLIEKYDQPHEEIPVAKMRDFYARLGLDTSPLIFISKRQDFDTSTRQTYQEPATLVEVRNDTDNGQYIHKKGLGVVVKDRSSNPAATTAHELGHSSGVHIIKYGRNREGISFKIENSGFPSHTLLEEGRAELLGMNCLAATTSLEEQFMTFSRNGAEYALTPKHRYSAGAFPGAMAIELLIGIDPEIAPLIVRGDSRLEAMRELKTRIEAIEPRLFSQFTLMREKGLGAHGKNVAEHLLEKFYDADPRAVVSASDYTTAVIGHLMTDSC